MKKLTKLALAMAAAGMSMSVVAANVNLVHGQDSQGSYAFESMDVASDGTITVRLEQPLSDVPSDYCGTNTTWNGTSCVSAGPLITCGVNTTLVGSVCEADAPDLTAPTLNITGVSSMGDGVSTATLTFQFSRDVQGFTAGDISVSQGSISNFTKVNDSRWTATYNRSGNNSGTVTVSVGSGSYQGTNGVGGGSASRTITLVGGSTNVGNCTVPNSVSLNSSPAVTTFGQPQGQIEFLMPRSPGVLSGSFTTPSGGSNGQIDLAGITQTSNHMRKMWISDCPGGTAVAGCDSGEGNLSTMRWVVGTARGVSCKLSSSRTYYFNLSSSSCGSSGGCGAYVQQLGGW